jgi:hypothetical protein
VVKRFFRTAASNGLSVHPLTVYEYGELRFNDIGRGNRRTRAEFYPSATLNKEVNKYNYSGIYKRKYKKWAVLLWIKLGGNLKHGIEIHT